MTEYRLEELFDLQMGKTPARNEAAYWDSGDYRWISIGDLSKCGKYITETKECISERAVQDSGISLIPANTVIMSFKLSIGKTAITAEPMYSNEAIMSFRDRHVADLLPDYIYYLLSGRDWDEGTNKAVMGKTLNKATLSKVKVMIHDVDQQREIVSVLDKVSSVIAARKQELAALDDLIKARFVEMFDVNVQSVKLGSICKMINGDRGKNYPSGNDFVSEGIPFINAGHLQNRQVSFSDMNYITEEKYTLLSQGKVQPDDILYCLRGSLGKHALVSVERGAVASSLVILRCDTTKVLPSYLLYAIETPDIENQLRAANNGSSQPNLSAASVKAYDIKLPSIEDQRVFVEFVSQVDKSKVAVQKALDEAQVLFDSLMQQYFG